MSSSSSSLVSLVIIIMYFSLMNYCAFGGRNLVESDQFITFNVSSFFSSSTCQPSVQGPNNKRASLKVTHAYGPCSKQSKGGKNVEEILASDQIRVPTIQKRHASNTKLDLQPSLASNAIVTIPATYGGGDYSVSVGLGTPAKYLNLALDTGSSLTWTQCQPCAGTCYNQQEPIFDPSASSSYSNVSCNSAECSIRNCPTSTSTCVYGTKYGDNSTSIGFLANERLTLTPNDFNTILFGCGEANRLTGGNYDGIFGLGRDSLSVISQTAQKYEKYFSYCLPTITGSNGHLTFGKNSDTGNIAFTPLVSSSEYYVVSIEGISVSGRQLPISPSVFKSGGSVIDSGTTITSLAPTIYTALRDAFRQGMSMYPSAPATSLLDTCYDLTNITTLIFPRIRFNFAGNVNVDLDFVGTFVAYNPSQVCLAFTSNKADTDLGIYGNVQQRTFEIVYDVAGGRLGFRQGGCS